MSSHDPKVTLLQLADFIREAQALTKDRSLDDILDDPVRLRAFERVMELVGEAAKRLPLSLREALQKFPGARLQA